MHVSGHPKTLRVVKMSGCFKDASRIQASNELFGLILLFYVLCAGVACGGACTGSADAAS